MPLPAFLYLSAEQKACLGGEGKVSPTFLSRSKNSSYSFIEDSWRKVVEAVVLDMQKVGKLEVSQHEKAVRWCCGNRKEKMKIREKVLGKV